MKLKELDIPAIPAEVIDELDAASIQIARLPRPATVGSAPSETTKPPPVVFVTDQPRHTRVSPRAALALIVVTIATAFLWVLIESSSGGGSAGSHKVAVHLTPAQERTLAYARARAAAIAKAKRDRGTDAQWGDTIPAVTPPPTGATNVTLPATEPAATVATP